MRVWSADSHFSEFEWEKINVSEHWMWIDLLYNTVSVTVVLQEYSSTYYLSAYNEQRRPV